MINWKICLFVPLTSIALIACNDSDNKIADDYDVQLTENDTNPSSFISSVDISGVDTSKITSATFEIVPKNGALADPISATFSATSLDMEAQEFNLPIYGMYSDYDNTINVTITYTDNSHKTYPIDIFAPKFVEPDGVLDKPVIDEPLTSKDNIGFSYFLIKKANQGGGIIFDIDGEPRWALAYDDAPNTQSINIDTNNNLIYHDASQMRIDTLYGKTTNIPFTVDGLSSIDDHHNLEPGKLTNSYLFSVNAIKEGHTHRIIESIVLEVTSQGEVLHSWDFGDILSKYLETNGEDPSDFVRDGIDWFHINTVVYDKFNDALIVSSRENFVISIDYETSTINWIFGAQNKHWYEDYPAFQTLALNGDQYSPNGQHAVSVLGKDKISLFNNNYGTANNPSGTSSGDSTGPSYLAEYQLDTVNKIAKTVWVYDNGAYSNICSSVYKYNDGSRLALYAVADQSTKMLVKIFSSNNDDIPVFNMHFDKPESSTCNNGWNAIPVTIEHTEY